MNTITFQELNDRITWTLSQKIDHSLYVIDSFFAQYPNCRVAFSGGVDSTVMLDLVKMLKKDVIPVFGNTTNEHSEILRFVKSVDNINIVHPETTFIKVIEEYGFPMISKRVKYAIKWVVQIHK